MSLQNLKIEKASFFDMNKIVKMAFNYHREDPKFQEILSNPVKLFFYRIIGPLYVWLKCESFKAVVSGRIVGHILLRTQVHGEFSIHIWDIVVHPDFRSKGIGTSLMKFVEKIANGKYQYLTLAVMENNTGALRLYQKLGYKNLQFSPICFRIKEIPTRMRSWNTIRLESISGEEALSCRNIHLLTVVEAVLGSDERVMFQTVYLLGKSKGGVDRFKIAISNKESGYISIERKKNLTSIFFILHPDFWGTDTEVGVIERTIDHFAETSGAQIEICVMQAYEESLTMALNKMGIKPERIISRLSLVKKLEGTIISPK